MLKMEIVCRAQRQHPALNPAFDVWPHLHPDGTLELRSALPGESGADAADPIEAMRAVKEGEVSSVVWNHSNIADRVHQRTSRNREHTVWLGSDGKHDFASLRYLLQTDRQMAARMIGPALERPAGRRRRRPRRRSAVTSWLPGGIPSPARRLVRGPLGYIRRAY